MRLRTKVTLFFGLIALIATVSLTIATYAFARSSCSSSAPRWPASKLSSTHYGSRPSCRAATRASVTSSPTIQTERGGFAFVRLRNGTPFATNTRSSDADFPEDLREASSLGISGIQRFTLDNKPYIGVAIPIAEVEADYYEAFEPIPPRTPSSILLALVIGSAITVLLATGVGIWTSRRLVQPLGRITDAAGEIAAGDLSTSRPRRRPRPRPPCQLVQRHGRRRPGRASSARPASPPT